MPTIKTKIVLAHAEDEESIAEQVREALETAGYEVVHRGTVLVGESYTKEFRSYLNQHFPVVVCGTINACGTGWVGRIVSAAQTSDINVFPIKLQAKADLGYLIPSDMRIIDCSGPLFDKGMNQLINALQKYHPIDDENLESQEVLLTPNSSLDKLTPETAYS